MARKIQDDKQGHKMKVYEIPLASFPEKFTISLKGQTYLLQVRFHEEVFICAGTWVLDIFKENTPFLTGLPLVTGTDLFSQFSHLGFGGKLILNSILPATSENLGKEVKLCFVTEE